MSFPSVQRRLERRRGPAGGGRWYSVMGGLFPENRHGNRSSRARRERRHRAGLDAGLPPLWSPFREFLSLRVMYICAEVRGLFRTQPPRPILPLTAPRGNGWWTRFDPRSALTGARRRTVDARSRPAIRRRLDRQADEARPPDAEHTLAVAREEHQQGVGFGTEGLTEARPDRPRRRAQRREIGLLTHAPARRRGRPRNEHARGELHPGPAACCEGALCEGEQARQQGQGEGRQEDPGAMAPMAPRIRRSPPGGRRGA